MQIHSQEEAERYVYQYVWTRYPDVHDSSIATLRIVTDHSIELETGWVIEYDITYQNPDVVLLGHSHYFVDKRTGRLEIFGKRPDVRLQEAVYQAVHNEQTLLPWPMLSAATLDGRHHLSVNVFLSQTLCGEIVEQPLFRPLIEVDWRTRQVCNICPAYVQILGQWCHRCGCYIIRDQTHVCTIPEPVRPPLAPEDDFWRD
jgi:hypothetical protein